MGPAERQYLADVLRTQAINQKPEMVQLMLAIATLLTCSDNEDFYMVLFNLHKQKLLITFGKKNEYKNTAIATYVNEIDDEEYTLGLATVAAHAAMIAKHAGLYQMFSDMLGSMTYDPQ